MTSMNMIQRCNLIEYRYCYQSIIHRIMTEKLFYLSFYIMEWFQIVKYSIKDVERKKLTTRIRWQYIFALIDISLLERTYHIYPITLLLFYIVCRWMHHCMKKSERKHEIRRLGIQKLLSKNLHCETSNIYRIRKI